MSMPFAQYDKDPSCLFGKEIPPLVCSVESLVDERQFEFVAGISDEALVDALTEPYSLRGTSYYRYAAKTHSLYRKTFSQALKSVWVRQSLAERLRCADDWLHSRLGVRLFLLDGFRPVELQTELFSFHYEAARDRLGENVSAEDLEAEAAHYIARPVIAGDFCPPHASGAAVDLILCDGDSGLLLEMGAQFDDPHARCATRYYEAYSDGSESARAARMWRRVLFWIMREIDLVNYPGEFFHFADSHERRACVYAEAEGLRPPKSYAYGPIKDRPVEA